MYFLHDSAINLKIQRALSAVVEDLRCSLSVQAASYEYGFYSFQDQLLSEVEEMLHRMLKNKT